MPRSIEAIGPSESLADRLYRYIPSKETLRDHPCPRPNNLEIRKYFRDKFPGAEYALVFSHLVGKFIIIPSWHDLNLGPKEGAAKQYGQHIFEGMSVEPVLSEGGEIIGANLILFEPRLTRLARSSKAQNFSPPSSLLDFKQGICDLVSILGKDVLVDRIGRPSRGYVTPAISRGEGGLGIAKGERQQIDMTLLSFNWPFYFEDPERVYHGEGLKVAVFTDEQRLSKIHGKEAGNYCHAGPIKERARALGCDEALILGPYTVDDGVMKEDKILYLKPPDLRNSLVYDVVICDGTGEEVAAVSFNEDFWYPPMDVNRLGGTTLEYVANSMAPRLGVSAFPHPFSLRDIEEGRIKSLMYLGNAARLAPIGKVNIYDEENQLIDEINLEIHPLVRTLYERYEGEVSGRIEPSGPALLTPVDLDEGKKARLILNDIYSNWL